MRNRLKGRGHNLSMDVYKERQKVELDAKRQEVVAVSKENKVIDMKRVEAHKTENQRKVIPVTPYQYKQHKLAKDILVHTVGTTSKALQEKKITKEEFSRLQVDGAKLAIRKVGITNVVRAYREVLEFLLTIPGRKSNGILILFQPLHDYMKKYDIFTSNLVDAGLDGSEVPVIQPENKEIENVEVK